jgi:hypothetical protein
VKKLLYLKFGLFAFGLLAHTESAPDFKLVVTGNLQGIHEGHEAFYDSPLFKLGDTSPIQIKNARLEAYTAKNTIYFSEGPIDLKKLVYAIPSGLKKKFIALDAPQLFCFKKNSKNLVNFDEDSLRRDLGGVPSKIIYETITIDSQTIYAVNISNEQDGVYWASDTNEIKKVNAVLATNSKNEQYYFFPRDFLSTKQTFKLVDKLLKDGSGIPTRYVDLGNALTSRDHENLDVAIEMSQLLQNRTPAALALGRYDLNVLGQLPNKTPYIGALTGNGAPPNSRRVRIGTTEVRFLALGEISNIASGFLGEDLKLLTTKQSIERIKLNQDDVVIGLSENRESAAEAIEYPALDMVLSLSNVRGGALPASDDINLEENQALGVRTVAPLVRISSSDVTEVSVWTNTPGQIKRILVKRHPVVGDLATQKYFYGSALPQKEWKETDFETLLANILLNAYPHSELVIIDKRAQPTPIDSSLPMTLAQTLIAPSGRGIEINLGGYYLKQILKAIRQDQFDISVVVTNMLQREISESESYKLVVSEKVLAAISDFIARESLFASTSNPSGSVQTALSESNKDAHKFLAELRKREDKSSDSLEKRYKLLTSSPSMAELVLLAIQQKTPLDVRPERSVLLFDISDLDFGIKLSRTNDTLSNWQTDAKIPDGKAAFDENRFWDSKFTNLLIYAKTGLYYLMPRLEFGLVGSIKYFQPHTEPANPTLNDIKGIRPAKDSVKLETEVRIPIQAYVSPLFRLTYETQLWPNTILTNLPQNIWPRRVHDMRLFLGVSRKPRLGYELFRAGALLGYDFSRDTPEQSFGVGLEFGGAYRYDWKHFGFKIDSNFRKLFPIVSDPDKGRMGIVWLTDLSISVPIVAGFSASAMTSLTFGERMNQPWNYGVGYVFGLALSYGSRFKWLL